MTEFKTADMKEYGRQLYLENREKMLARNRDYYEANRDNILAKQRARSNYTNGELDPNTNTGRGFIAEMIVAKALGLESGARCNCTAKFGFDYDLLDMGGYGEINVKSSKLKEVGKNFYWNFNLENKYKPDTYIYVAYSEDHKDIEHVWIVPSYEYIISNKKWLTIYNSEKGLSRIQEFEVDNTMYNVWLHIMSIDRCSVLKSQDSISAIVAEVLER